MNAPRDFITRSIRFPAAVYAAMERRRAAGYNAQTVTSMVIAACVAAYGPEFESAASEETNNGIEKTACV